MSIVGVSRTFERFLGGLWGEGMEYLKPGVFWKILARISEKTVSILSKTVLNFSCRSASNGDENGGKRERNPNHQRYRVFPPYPC